MDAWELIKQQLMLRLSAESFQNWFGNTALAQTEHDAICVSVPNEVTRNYIQQEYTDLIQSVVSDLKLPVSAVRYEVCPGSAGRFSNLAELRGNGTREVSFQVLANQLNPKFTFDNYVVGSCNQFAHAAARAVTAKPSRVYNPLFLYGGVGMGKTHLMHAIGRALAENHPGMRIVYTSGERFMNEMINCIRLQRMPLFHRHYRSADVLLVDDIHILSGKDATQDEFFHTFNELYEHQKQIVISSDSPPKEIPGLVERLRSRFEWGLMADIQPPDLETKMAILDKKADGEGIQLPEDVRIFIATKTKSNVRELEGALIRLIAYSSMTETEINLAMAQQALKHLVHNQERRVTIDSIIRAVAAKFDLQPSQLKQKSNARVISHPRQIAMYLAKEMTPASLPEIGRAFGGKHHTTVLHSIKKITRDRQKDPDLNKLILSLTDSLS